MSSSRICLAFRKSAPRSVKNIRKLPLKARSPFWQFIRGESGTETIQYLGLRDFRYFLRSPLLTNSSTIITCANTRATSKKQLWKQQEYQSLLGLGPKYTVYASKQVMWAPVIHITQTVARCNMKLIDVLVLPQWQLRVVWQYWGVWIGP